MSSVGSDSATPNRCAWRIDSSKRHPGFHAFQDDIGRGIQHSAKAANLDRRQRLAKERKDRHAIHHRRLEKKSPSFGRSQIGQFPIGVHHRAFVGADGMGAGLQRRPNMVDRRLPRGGIQGAGFKQRVRLCPVAASRERQQRPAPRRNRLASNFSIENPSGAVSQPSRREATPVIRQAIP